MYCANRPTFYSELDRLEMLLDFLLLQAFVHEIVIHCNFEVNDPYDHGSSQILQILPQSPRYEQWAMLNLCGWHRIFYISRAIITLRSPHCRPHHHRQPTSVSARRNVTLRKRYLGRRCLRRSLIMFHADQHPACHHHQIATSSPPSRFRLPGSPT